MSHSTTLRELRDSIRAGARSAVETCRDALARIDQVETVLGNRISAVESGLRAEMSGLRAEMRELELRLEARIDRIVVRLGSLTVILAGIILAAIRYLPHS